MADDPYHFEDPIAALLFLIGYRCVTHTESPTSVSGLRARLVDDGKSVRMWMPTKNSGISCTATLPHRMTPGEFEQFHWLSWIHADGGALRSMKTAGSA
jgi:hypothetical protein